MFPEVIDSSMISEYRACASKFKLTYIDQWKPKQPNVHLHAGASFARGIEVARRAFYEQGLAAQESVAMGLGALLEHYGDFQAPEDSAKTAPRMAGALEFYFERYPLNHDAAFPVLMPGGRRAIEFNFVHPLPVSHPDTGQPLQYCGRSDAIQAFAGGVFGFDEKTTTQLGASWGKQWGLRGQFTGYCWGAREAGIAVQGWVIRGVSILKTKYETQECITYRDDFAVTRWYTELLDTIQEMIHCYQTKRWTHNLDKSCSDFGGCQFLRACDTAQPLNYLETSHERRHWDPVTRIETLLP